MPSVPKNALMMTIPPIFPPPPHHGQGFPGSSFLVRHGTDIPSSQYNSSFLDTVRQSTNRRILKQIDNREALPKYSLQQVLNADEK